MKEKGVNLARAQDIDKKRVAKTTDEGAFREKDNLSFCNKRAKISLKGIIQENHFSRLLNLTIFTYKGIVLTQKNSFFLNFSISYNLYNNNNNEYFCIALCQIFLFFFFNIKHVIFINKNEKLIFMTSITGIKNFF